jgi:biopolymer transport protein TolQ
VDLGKLYAQVNNRESSGVGLQAIFCAGFKEFTRLRQQTSIQPNAVMEGVQRAMRIACLRETDRLEHHLAFLATVGSTSPYIGLFGTVLGIMTSFQSLMGSGQQATIAMVAPGISEALIATAMGLFAAIPAVIAYNRFSNQVERLLNQYGTFQEELSSILHRKTHTGKMA